MFTITNKGTAFDVSTCVKFRKSKQFAKTTFKKNNPENLMHGSDILARIKKKENKLKKFANNHIWKQNALFLSPKKSNVQVRQSDSS